MDSDFENNVEEKVHTQNRLVPLVTFEEDSIQFDEDVARETFANPLYQNSKISLVSVMGPSRSGKSFLMSLLTNDIKNNSIRGAFQSGMERHTEGILIFINPIFIGENHVVFFLDTQGTFDMKTDRNVSVWIAGFSLLISDIQIINLVGNIGGNDLHDIHLFVETAATLQGGRLAKTLMFVIRDTPSWDDGTFLENLWARCENSSDLKEISESLRKRFSNAIECFCANPASDNIRYANGYVELQEDDTPLISSLSKIKSELYNRCRDSFQETGEDLIQKAQRIIYFLQNDAPRLKPTVTMGQEASVAVAVNRACEAFRIGLKGTTADTLEMAVLMGRQEVSRRLKELLKDNNILEAQALVDPKIEELINEKLQEFKNLENDKMIQRKGDEFFARWKGNILKLSKLDEALEMEKSDAIRKEAEASGIEIPETSFQLLQNSLNDRIVILKSQYINAQLAELNLSMRQELANVEMKTSPNGNWVEQQVALRVETLKDQCSNLEIPDAEWREIELEARKTLNVTAQNALKMIELRIETRKQEEALQRELKKKEIECKEQEIKRQAEEERFKVLKLQEAAQEAPKQVKTARLSGENSFAKDNSTDNSKPKKISLFGEDRLLRQSEEEKEKQRREIERRFREIEQSLLKQAATPKQFVVEIKVPTSSNKDQFRNDSPSKIPHDHREHGDKNASSGRIPDCSYVKSENKTSLYAREENKAKQIMEHRLRVLKKTPAYGAALIDEFRHALKVYATECRKAQVAESDYHSFLDKLLNECLETARKCRMRLDTSSILLPTLRSPFYDSDAMDLKAQIKKGTRSRPYVKWCEESFQKQFNLRLEQSFKEVVFVNELTVKRLIENSRALRKFFLDFADPNEQQLRSQGLQLVNECINKQWRTLFQTKPVNPVFFEEMSFYLQMVERELNVQMDSAIYSFFSIYPRNPQFAVSSPSFPNTTYSSNRLPPGSSNHYTQSYGYQYNPQSLHRNQRPY